jgi:uncharacterized integral membrane protein (TIGR00698 family)
MPGSSAPFPWAKLVFWGALATTLTPILGLAWVTPPVALALGVTFAFLFDNPYRTASQRGAKLLLQASVVGLGFGLDIHAVLDAGRTGLGFTVVSLFGALGLGLLLGRLLRVSSAASKLIAVGTAVCGGSAIAAIAPVIDADEADLAVALGTVFVLNAVALFLFPVIGLSLGLSDEQFGVWAAVAIHDTSSVVGAASRFGEKALGIATTVKLARALWIVPLTPAFAWTARKKGTRLVLPYFILLFLLASIARTFLPAVAEVSVSLVGLAKVGLSVTLFLIGTGLSPHTLRAVGLRPLAQGLVLWIVTATLTLLAVLGLLAP